MVLILNPYDPAYGPMVVAICIFCCHHTTEEYSDVVEGIMSYSMELFFQGFKSLFGFCCFLMLPPVSPSKSKVHD